MRAIEVDDLDQPLPAIEAALRRAYPKEKIQTVGLGLRRRNGAVDPETVLVVVVREKLERVPRGRRRLPKAVEVVGRWLGTPVRTTLPIDVEPIRTAEPTRHRLIGLTGGHATLGCYATWKVSGRDQFGCLTTGHAMWRDPGDARPRRTARVELPPTCPDATLTGTVVAASHLVRDGVDVALVRFPRRPDGRPHPCLRNVQSREYRAATPSELVGRLGNAGDTAEVLARFKQPFVRTPTFESVAYYDRYPVRVGHGWGNVVLRGTVESLSSSSTFVGGTSGAGIVSEGGDKLSLGLQSLCLDPGTNTHSLASSFHRSLAWLASEHGLAVTPLWKLPG